MQRDKNLANAQTQGGARHRAPQPLRRSRSSAPIDDKLDGPSLSSSG